MEYWKKCEKSKITSESLAFELAIICNQVFSANGVDFLSPLLNLCRRYLLEKGYSVERLQDKLTDVLRGTKLNTQVLKKGSIVDDSRHRTAILASTLSNGIARKWKTQAMQKSGIFHNFSFFFERGKSSSSFLNHYL